MLAEWVTLYLEEAPPLFHAMQMHLAEGDAVLLARVAHELRPQAHYLGAAHLLELLIALEARLLEQGVGACVDQVEEVVLMGREIERELCVARTQW